MDSWNVNWITWIVRAFLCRFQLTMRSLPELEDDHRIKRLLSDLDKRYTGQDFNSSQNKKTAGSVTPDMLDGVLHTIFFFFFHYWILLWIFIIFMSLKLSKQSFAPCMRHLHETMRATHHLKHGGRIQYGLFIKGIGLSLEHSLKFWRDEFSKHMDIDKVNCSSSNSIDYQQFEGEKIHFFDSLKNSTLTRSVTITEKKANESTTRHTVASKSSTRVLDREKITAALSNISIRLCSVKS